MKKETRNRPMIGKEPAKAYNISLPPEVAERLRKAGAGNLSAGVRLAESQMRLGVKAK
jgi:hypothetical protein